MCINCTPVLVQRIASELMTFAPEIPEDKALDLVVDGCQEASLMWFGDEDKLFTIDPDHPEIMTFKEVFITTMFNDLCQMCS